MSPNGVTVSTMTGERRYTISALKIPKHLIHTGTLIGLKSMPGWIHFEISWMKEVLDPTVICKYV